MLRARQRQMDWYGHKASLTLKSRHRRGAFGHGRGDRLSGSAAGQDPHPQTGPDAGTPHRQNPTRMKESQQTEWKQSWRAHRGPSIKIIRLQNSTLGTEEPLTPKTHQARKRLPEKTTSVKRESKRSWGSAGLGRSCRDHYRRTQHPEKNDVAITEEVRLKWPLQRRPDLLMYVNGNRHCGYRTQKRARLDPGRHPAAHLQPVTRYWVRDIAFLLRRLNGPSV